MLEEKKRLEQIKQTLDKFEALRKKHKRFRPYGELVDTCMGFISRDFAEHLVMDHVLIKKNGFYSYTREQINHKKNKKSVLTREAKEFVKKYNQNKKILMQKHNTSLISPNDTIASVLQGTYNLLEPHLTFLQIENYVKKYT